MEGTDALGMIAEIGIAVAGFAGVVATLRAPGGRIGALLATSAEAVLLALLPFALHFAGLTSATIWALSSTAMAALVATVFLGSIRIATIAAPAPEDRAPGIRLVFGYTIAIQTGIVALQLTNAVFYRKLWPFYLGLLALTAHSLFQFAYIHFAPSRSELQQ